MCGRLWGAVDHGGHVVVLGRRPRGYFTVCKQGKDEITTLLSFVAV